MLDNPFVTKGYAGSTYFCDRVEETKRIIELVTNDNNIALISPRRVGKTDLIRHCFAQPSITERFYTFHIDIYATSSLRDFVNILGRTILDTLKPKGRKAWEGFLNMIRSVRSEVSFDINNYPIWSLGLGDIEHPENTLDEIFSYLGTADKPCLVAIDEFQQITKYTDNRNVEAILRTYIQRCFNATFIFAGSKRHLMGEIFTSPSRPFYQSVLVMNLKPISAEKYIEFAQQLFQMYDKKIEAEVIMDIYNRFDAITSCIQRMLNVLFLKTLPGTTCTTSMIPGAIDYILDMLSETYETLTDKIPEKQREVFLAIAKEGKAQNITSKAFMKKYHLQTASVVTAAVRSLLEKDFLTHDQGTYQIYDPFYMLWLKTKA